LCTLIAGSHAPAAPARFWAKVLDWQALYEANHEVVVGKGQDTCPRRVFVLVPGAKSVKNQLHIDLAPTTATRRSPAYWSWVRGASTGVRDGP
jgi:hypothetical protein